MQMQTMGVNYEHFYHRNEKHSHDDNRSLVNKTNSNPGFIESHDEVSIQN